MLKIRDNQSLTVAEAKSCLAKYNNHSENSAYNELKKTLNSIYVHSVIYVLDIS
jgi:DNA-directed RNA polymerase subunit F